MNNSNAFDCLDEIAIVGMAGCFPGAKNIDKLWQNLRDGVESISFFTDEEMVSSGIDSAKLGKTNYVKAGAVLENIDLFDASFFGFNPREAEITDPQHRLFLESAWEALEGAGYGPETYAGRIGVYAGASMSTYFLSNLYPNRELIESVGGKQILIGNSQDFLPTHVSYKLNLKGPSINVQTTCSTSLVAVHLACQSLLNGESDIALAGGVSINVPHKEGYRYQEGGILSPDGHCRAFDAKAQGTVGGNGVGIVVLKRLEDAIADGDCIHAVIKGSAINNDGSQKVGYTAPSVDGQAQVIAEALAVATIEAEMVSYVEAHGTGTVLGDPIEIAALTKAFRTASNKKSFCAIGSVKTNIGHLDTAAGVAGLIKTVLALKHKQIPPSLHFERPNPQIDFANSPFYVNDKLSEWKSNGHPRRAGVSSFGIGGTNAHVILEEAPTVEASGASRQWQLLTISAKTRSALETATANLVKHLKQHPDLNLADVAYTLEVGRRAFDHRRIVVCQDIDDAVKVLDPPDPQRVLTHFQEPCNRQVVFMFPGQGAQYVQMGRELYQTEPIFREQVDRCSGLLNFHLGLDLRTVLYPHEEQAEAAAQQLKQTYITQPALFVVEYALAQLWMAWGIRPQAMIGHSIGEYVAACLAGVFSLEDALVLVAIRGQLMQQLPSGTMLAVPLSEKEIEPLLGEISLAASNGPDMCVVSGPTEEIDDLQNRLTEQGVDCRHLHTSHAFHSQMMDSILEPFMEQVSKASLNPPRIPFVSNLTGTWITQAEATDPKYWARHLRQTVRFAEGIAQLLKEPEQILLEVGPGRTLSTLASKQKAAEQVILSSLRHPQNQQSDVAFLLNTLGRLWLEGVQVDWSEFYAHERRHRLPLPTYPFERKRYWIEPPKANEYNPAPKSEISMFEPKDVLIHSLQHNRIFSILKGILGNSLGVSSSEIDIHTRLLEMGVDSLLLLQINRAILEQLGVEIPFYLLLEDSLTIDSLVIHIAQKLPPEELTAELPQESVSTVTPQALTERPFFVKASDTQALNQKDERPVASTNIEQMILQHLQVMSKLLDLLPDGGSSGTGEAEPLKLRFQAEPGISRSQAQPGNEKSTGFSTSTKAEPDRMAGLSPRQQKHLDALISRFVKRTKESKRLTQAYRPYHANSRTVTGFLPSIKEMLYPIHGQRGEGARLWDVDGNEYVDISMGFGTLLFGHSPSFVIEAVQEQIQQGILHGPQSRLAGQVAELICELTGQERAAFCNDGTEAVMGAIRLARTATGRSKIALFAGSYHGSLDEVLVKGVTTSDGTQRSIPKAQGIPQHITENVMVLDYGTPESLNMLKAHAQELAAILVEPVQSSRPDLQPIEFLRKLRQLTQETGTVLIFDEVITGFRMHPGGIQALWDIQADLTTYGKAVGAGMPIGVLAGKAAFMDALDGGMWNYGDETYPQVKATFFAGTFFKHPLVMAAAWAALNHIKNSGPKLQEELTQKTTKLAENLNSYFEQKQVQIRVINFGSLFRFNCQTQLSNLLFYHLLEKGIYVWEGRTLYLSTAHTDEDIEQVIRAVKESVVEMQAGEFLPLNFATGEAPLVTIQPRGSKRPLFFIHPIGGNVFCYKELARCLGSDQPFYGLQAPGLYGEREAHTRIEDMATHYITAIRVVQPEGPYLLGGWSLGSFVAFEMATQLQKQGHQVSLLTLLDNSAPVPNNKLVDIEQDDDSRILANFAKDIASSAGKNLAALYDKFHQLGYEEQLNYVLQQLQMANLIPVNFDLQQFCLFLNVYKSNLRASLNYVPHLYPNRMVLFRASDSDEGFDYPDDPSWGWSNLSSEPLETLTVPGNHYTMLAKPHVQVLAERLRAYLDRHL